MIVISLIIHRIDSMTSSSVEDKTTTDQTMLRVPLSTAVAKDNIVHGVFHAVGESGNH